jgi:hypothetical protein
MRTGRPTPLVVLTAEERQTLEQWARRPTTVQGLAQRARLVLACASTKTNGEIAAARPASRGKLWGAGGIASSGSDCRGCSISASAPENSQVPGDDRRRGPDSTGHPPHPTTPARIRPR